MVRYIRNWLDYPYADPGFSPTVSITSAVYGIHAAGTIYRMDNVPLSLRKLWDTDLPTDEYVLSEIAKQCHGGELVQSRELLHSRIKQ